jgi:hypothetical protein
MSGELFSNQHRYVVSAAWESARSVHSVVDGEARNAVGRVAAWRIAVL